jgi:hypothetical protein
MRPDMTLSLTPTPSGRPVLKSVDVDLATPPPAPGTRAMARAPRSRDPRASWAASTASKGAVMSQSPNRLSAQDPQRLPGDLPLFPGGAPGPSRAYPIQPTPTFSFVDELEGEPRFDARAGRRSGGGLVLLFLMALAGSGGYVAVKYRVWQDPKPLVERARELGRSLRTLAPGASLEPSPAPAPLPSPPAPRLAPEVVPITREPAAATSATPSHGGRAHHGP